MLWTFKNTFEISFRNSFPIKNNIRNIWNISSSHALFKNSRTRTIKKNFKKNLVKNFHVAQFNLFFFRLDLEEVDPYKFRGQGSRMHRVSLKSNKASVETVARCRRGGTTFRRLDVSFLRDNSFGSWWRKNSGSKTVEGRGRKEDNGRRSKASQGS